MYRPVLRPYSMGSISRPMMGSVTRNRAATQSATDQPGSMAAASTIGTPRRHVDPTRDGTKRIRLVIVPHSRGLGRPMKYRPAPTITPKAVLTPSWTPKTYSDRLADVVHGQSGSMQIASAQKLDYAVAKVILLH